LPKFLEEKLRAEYGNNPHAIFGTMNKLGAMHGSKETARGAQMQAKHDAKVGHTSHLPHGHKASGFMAHHGGNVKVHKGLVHGK
jgi:hypothetical protein